MAKIQTVVTERKKVCEEYRKHLEEEYIQKQRQIYEQKVLEEEKAKELEPKVPEITFNLLRAKYHDLKRGIDNTDYIKKALEIEAGKAQLKKYLDETYDYKNKKVVKNPEEAQPNDPNVILGFKSGILEQLNTGRYKLSQEEVLRSHVRNWKMLDLKQKRQVLGMINARRARDARSEFMKEINLLGQKLAYDKLQEQRAKGNA
jgi:large subunit ribosomal protein L47